MSHCPSCGVEVSSDLRFCLACGTSLAAAGCPSCGAARVPGAHFCGQCGTPLEAMTAALQSPRSVAPSPTERRLVSVLFADLVGFTAHSEHEDPEAVRDFLSAYFERAADVIGRYGGTVEKFIGDAVMAVWGTPTAHEDDAERATRAGLELIGLIADIDAATEIRAGVTTGEAAVTVGAKGQGLVAGDLVNTSSRLQSVAAPGSVLVDETTMVAAGRAISFEAAGEFSLKGKTEPVKAWTAMRVVAERGGSGRREVLEPPFVGREEELRLLKDSLHATSREGKSRLVTIVGQAGLGKSRLAWELKKYSDGLMESIYWHEGRSPAYGEGVAYWALGEMVRQRCAIRDAEDPDTARAKVAASVAEFVEDEEERDWIEPRLAALLGLAEVPAGEGQELFAAWRTFFERIAEHGMVALIFEDIHWADESLFDFIEHLLEWARSSAILVVALARPELLERRTAWGSGHRATTTAHLEPLSDDAMGDLLRGLVPGLPAAPLEQIVTRAEGVPLYAVETVRMLIDEERLVLEGERYRLVDESSAVAVPATLQALVTARLDALQPAERSVVQDAAVVGKTFAREELAAVGGRGDAELEALLPVLVRKEIIAVETSRTSPEFGHYGFVQGLLREVAYSTLSRRDRRARHLAAARYFETLDDEELAGLVASHYLDAYRSAPDGDEGEEAAAQASRALQVAAERSVSLHANAAALSFIEQALSVTSDPERRARLWEMSSEPAGAMGRLELRERYLKQAIEWYEQTGRFAEANRATATLAASLIHLSRINDVLELLQPAMDRLDIDAGSSAPRLLNELARAYLWDDRPDDAIEPLDRGLVIAERLQMEPEIAELFATKSWAVEIKGRHREAVLLAQGSLELAERHGIIATELRARMNLSNGLVTVDPRRSFEVSGRGVDIAKRVGHGTWAGALAGNQGLAALLIGEWDVTLRYLVEMEDWTEMTGFGRSGVLVPAGIVQAHRGILDEDQVREARAALEQLKTPQARAMELAYRSMLDYASGRLDGVVESAIASVGANVTPGEGVVAAALAARAATWLRDGSQMATLAAVLRDLSWMGVVPSTSLLQLEAASLALEGDLDAAERGYRDALAMWRRLGLKPDIATAQMEMLLLLGDRLDDREQLAEEAHQIIDQLGSLTLSARLKEIVPIKQEMEVAT